MKPIIPREQALETLKNWWKVEHLQFLGEFFRPKREDGSYFQPPRGQRPFGFIRNLRANDKRISYPPPPEGFDYDTRISYKVPLVKELEDERVYLVELELEDDKNRLENPYALKIKEIYILEEDVKTPKAFIEDWFYRKGENPDDARTIASQLKLNELELYTHTKRFIFELIQNADDMPFGQHPVEIQVCLLDNHLLFLHNGKFFDREDVKAISDAAKSTKAGDITQTGYKGIGFKSVFTDSYRVYIKSADYSFKFDKLSPIYKDFWKLYKGYLDQLNSKAKQEFKLRVRGKEAQYTEIDQIPWQIKPIWVEREEYPDELVNSPFGETHRVAIALEIGEAIITQKDYHGMVQGLISEPRFLLFLRNTGSLMYQRLSGLETDQKRLIEIRKNWGKTEVFSNQRKVSAYITHDRELSISNEAFTQAGFDFQRKRLEGGKAEFFDSNGRKLENIPEKLGRLNRTVLTFAAKIEEPNNIQRLPKDESILFNYLPTSDVRFGFPFLVNADFVSKTDREFIQIENRWNHFLFYHIGYGCISWISQLAAETYNNKEGKERHTYIQSYLRLLPLNLLDESNEELASINKAFNQGVRDALSEVAFILDSNLSIKKCDEIILDDTGISSREILGDRFFKQLSKTKKFLPHFLTDARVLRADYLEIERYTLEELINDLSETEGQNLLSEYLGKLNDHEYGQFLEWLDELVYEHHLDHDFIYNLPLLKVGEEVVSFADSLDIEEFLVLTEMSKGAQEIFSSLGFRLSSFTLDDYSSIMECFNPKDNYLGAPLELFSKIKACEKLSKLNASQKAKLVSFLDGLEGVGQKRIGALPLFNNRSGADTASSLSSLLSNSVTDLPEWLYPWTIAPEEERALSPEFAGLLIAKANLFSRLFLDVDRFLEIVENMELEDGGLAHLYKFLALSKSWDMSEAFPGLTDVPWLYVPATEEFLPASETYCPDSLLSLEEGTFENVVKVIEGTTDLVLPCFESLGLIAILNLNPQRPPFSQNFKNEGSFTLDEVLAFLEWSYENKEKKLFLFLLISKEGGKYRLFSEILGFQYYSEDSRILDSINNLEKPVSYFPLPSELFFERLDTLGLLTGEALIAQLLENESISIDFIGVVERKGSLEKKFLEELEAISLYSGVEYPDSTNEHKVLKLILRLGEEDEAAYNIASKIILINGENLETSNISDHVGLKFTLDLDNVEKEWTFTFRLSELLPAYKNKAEPVTRILESFSGLSGFERKILREKVFHLRKKSHKSISEEINSADNPEISTIQLAYLILLAFRNEEDLVLETKDFASSAFNSNNGKWKTGLTELVNFFFSNDFEFFNEKYFHDDLAFDQFVLPPEYALKEVESPPAWLTDWLDRENRESRYRFLEKCGAHTENSPLVLMRKALKTGDADLLKQHLYNINLTKAEYQNTGVWLMRQPENRMGQLEGKALKLFYEHISSKKLTCNEIPVPALLQITGDLRYQLVPFDAEKDYHYWMEDWEGYENEVFEAIKSAGDVVIDTTTPDRFIPSVLTEGINIIPDEETLGANSIPFQEVYYSDWEYRDKVDIKIFSGQAIPYLVVYQDKIISRKNDGTYLFFKEVHYVCERDEQDIPRILAELDGGLKSSLYDARDRYFQKDEGRKKADPELVLSEIEIQELEALLKRPLTNDEAANIWIVAAFRAIKHYESKGYDVDAAKDDFDDVFRKKYLENIISPEGITKNVLVRSARTKLLRLKYNAWVDLGYTNTELFVVTGNNPGNYVIYTDQNQLAMENDDPWVIRLDGQDKKEAIDSLICGHFNSTDFKFEPLEFLIRLKGNSDYQSIFEGFYKKKSYENIELQ